MVDIWSSRQPTVRTSISAPRIPNVNNKTGKPPPDEMTLLEMVMLLPSINAKLIEMPLAMMTFESHSWRGCAGMAALIDK